MIKLKNDYFIESDELQYVLKRKKISKKKDTGEEYETEEILGYYGDLEKALNGYSKKMMLKYVSSENVTLMDVLNKLKELEEEIKAYDQN